VITFTSDSITARLYNYSLFGQDTWKIARISPSPMPSLGDQYSPASVTPGKPLYAVTGLFDSNPVGLVSTPLWQTQFHNFAPRVGAAWRPTPASVVRAGFGLFYDLGYGVAARLDDGFPHSRRSGTVNSPAIPFDLNGAAFQPLPFTTTVSPTTSLTAVDPHLSSPSPTTGTSLSSASSVQARH